LFAKDLKTRSDPPEQFFSFLNMEIENRKSSSVILDDVAYSDPIRKLTFSGRERVGGQHYFRRTERRKVQLFFLF